MARLSINRTDRWHVKNDRQDIRGWPARDSSGNVVAHVQDLIANTDSNLVESVVLDSGNEVPASEIEISDGSVYLGDAADGHSTGAATGTTAGATAGKTAGGPTYKTAQGNTGTTSGAAAGAGAGAASGTTSGSSRTAYRDAQIREREPGSASGFAEHEPTFREHHRSSFGDTGDDYSQYHPAYRLGYEYGSKDDHQQQSWDQVEPDMRRRYEETRGQGGWQKVRDAARHAFQQARSGSSSTNASRTV